MQRERSLGCAHRFRPTYALANVGHPSFLSFPSIDYDAAVSVQRPEIWVRGGLGGGRGCCLLRKRERSLPTFVPMRSEANIRSPAVKPGSTWWWPTAAR